MKRLAYSINLLAGLVTVGVGIQSMDAFALGTLAFLIWAVSPYFLAALLTKCVKAQSSTLIISGLSVILATSGIFLLIDAMYIHSDAQGALAFIVIPLYQWIVLIIVTLTLFIIEKKHKGKLCTTQKHL